MVKVNYCEANISIVRQRPNANVSFTNAIANAEFAMRRTSEDTFKSKTRERDLGETDAGPVITLV